MIEIVVSLFLICSSTGTVNMRQGDVAALVGDLLDEDAQVRILAADALESVRKSITPHNGNVAYLIVQWGPGVGASDESC